jgi:hypothetical protein
VDDFRVDQMALHSRLLRGDPLARDCPHRHGAKTLANAVAVFFFSAKTLTV